VGYLFGFFLLVLLVSSVAAILMSMPAERLARILRLALPATTILLGGVLTFIGRGALGLPLILFGITLWGRNRSIGNMSSRANNPKSTVRTAMFEMELDHDSGEMDGVILTGAQEGVHLSQLSLEDLMQLMQSSGEDHESAALLEAYLDRRFPRWREDAEPNMNSGHGSTASTGPMTKEEAYQILGLSPGAGTNDIREAHRRLMKRIHPDSGGSTFLASKINEAKDVLLN
jgi:DnaJ-domain-containing protein 1